jgi:long-subunit fatty acid transport protein
VNDLGLTYYNPARIAVIENPVFSINAKAYQLNSIRFTNVFGRDDKLSDSQFEGVPSLVSGTFKIEKWEKHHFAYAFISRQRSNIGINISRELNKDNIFDNPEDVDRVVGDLLLNFNERDEWFGATWGMKIRDNLSIGVSGFVSVYNYSSVYDFRVGAVYQSEDVSFFNNEINFSQNSYGMFWKLGLAWNLNKINLGLNVDFPYLEVVKNGKFRYQRYLSGSADRLDEFAYYDFKDLESNRKEPLGISFGAGIPWHKNKFHLKVDWHGNLSEYNRLVIPDAEDGREGFAFKESLRSVINFGAGAEIYINDGLNLYGSFSTDFSPVEASANIFDLIPDESDARDANFDADYFHYGLGVEIKLKKLELILGTTYSSASGDFADPLDLPFEGLEPMESDDLSRIKITRWRFIVGLEIPIFGYELEFK